MLASLAHLIELQRVDLRIAELATELAGLPKLLAQAEAPVTAARAALGAAKDAHLANVKERKKFELDVESWKEKGRKYRDQSGAVKSNEAYKALLHEIETADNEARKAEDKLLEHMVSGEEFDRQMKAGQKALAEAEATAKTEQARIAAEQARIEQESAKYKAEREKAVAGVPADLLAQYQKLVKRHHGHAVAPMIGEACTGCRVHLRPHMVQKVRQLVDEEIVECDSCTRILYYVEEPKKPEAGAAPAGPAAAAPSEKK